MYRSYNFYEGQTHFNFKIGSNCRHKVLTYTEVFKNKLSSLYLQANWNDPTKSI